MTENRRQRADSTQAAVKAFADARKAIEWPEEAVTRLPKPEDADRAAAIFTRIMTARAPDDYRQFDVVLAASLANTSVELDKLNAIVAKAGWVTGGAGKSGDKFTRTPLLDPIQHLTTRQLSLARSLGLSGLPTDAKTVAANGRTAAEARRANNVLASAGLLAGYDDEASLI